MTKPKPTTTKKQWRVRGLLAENESISDRFPSDGIWLVMEDRRHMRKLTAQPTLNKRRVKRLLDPMELLIMCGFEQHRDVLCKAVHEIMDAFRTRGISPDDGASIIIDLVAKAQMKNMKGVELDADERRKLDRD
jgi:hypothetical protein